MPINCLTSSKLLMFTGCVSALLATLAACAPKAETSNQTSVPLSSSDARAKTDPVDAVVVGGGLAGLVSAYELEKQGLRVVLLEATERFGGKVNTADYGNGLKAEFGTQELWEGNPLLGIAKELGVALDPPDVAYSSVLIDGKVWPFVQENSAAFLATLFSAAEQAARNQWLAEAKTLLDAAKTRGLAEPAVAKLQTISFGNWVASTQIPKRVGEWIRLTIECELGADWEQFSALAGLLEFEVFFNGETPNYHVQGGNERLTEALAKAIRGDKQLLAMVTHIRHEGQGSNARVTVKYLQRNQVHTVVAKRAVIAVPFTRLHQIAIEPPLPDTYWSAINTLGFGKYVVVHLLIDKSHIDSFKIQGESPFPILTRSGLGVIYGVAEEPPAGQDLAVFSLLIYGPSAKGFHMMPRDAMAGTLTSQLEALWPGIGAHIRDTSIYGYHPAALPLWPPGRSSLDAGAQLLRTPVAGLYLAGDYTENAHSDGAARSGLRVASQIAGELRP